jgi:glycosyltransferase involved in cell wall biosynthesis
MREDLENLRTHLNLDKFIYMPGFQQYADLPEFYATAGAFVHASSVEQWGLVVNEAMASGLPVLVSNRCGCADELVDEGHNGFTFDPSDVESLAAMMVLLSDRADRSTMGVESRRIMAKYGPERFASGFKAAAQLAIKKGVPHLRIADEVILRLVAIRQNRVLSG